MMKIKVQMLTAEAFAPFGQVIETEGKEFGGEAGMYRWYEKQAQVDNAETVSINLLTAIQRDYVFNKFEAHARTTETVLPLTGGLVVAGIPAGAVTPDKLSMCRLARAFPGRPVPGTTLPSPLAATLPAP